MNTEIELAKRVTELETKLNDALMQIQQLKQRNSDLSPKSESATSGSHPFGSSPTAMWQMFDKEIQNIKKRLQQLENNTGSQINYTENATSASQSRNSKQNNLESMERKFNVNIADLQSLITSTRSETIKELDKNLLAKYNKLEEKIGHLSEHSAVVNKCNQVEAMTNYMATCSVSMENYEMLKATVDNLSRNSVSASAINESMQLIKVLTESSISLDNYKQMETNYKQMETIVNNMAACSISNEHITLLINDQVKIKTTELNVILNEIKSLNV
jgi:hypothetical protein